MADLPSTPWGKAEALLGSGALSSVYLLPAVGGQPRTAVKVMSKAIVTFLRATKSVLQERAALVTACAAQMRPPYIMCLLDAMHDADHIYLRLEAILVGAGTALQLRHLLRTFLSGLEPAAAACTAHCVANALAYLHSNHIAHRDVTPENVVLDASGIAKLVDLGSAKCMADGEQTLTFCGTDMYMAPEMLARRGHGCRADAWSLGVLICEALCGRTLEALATAAELHADRSLVHRAVSGLAHGAAALVEGLLQEDPEERLSALAASQHVWLQSPDWAALCACVHSTAQSLTNCEANDDVDEDTEERLWAAAEREDLHQRAEAAWVNGHREEAMDAFEPFGAFANASVSAEQEMPCRRMVAEASSRTEHCPLQFE